jgi:magnesium transporter
MSARKQKKQPGYPGSDNSRSRKRHQIRLSPPGTPPGTLFVDPAAPLTTIQVLCYGQETVEEFTLQDPQEVVDLLGKRKVTWINVMGLGNPGILHSLGEILKLHPLSLEDVVNVHQRPKSDLYGNRLFLVLRMIRFSDGSPQSEQISLFLGENFVISFQEGPENNLETIHRRILEARGRIRTQGADYLAYCLMDTIVDLYYPVLETYGELLDTLEESVLRSPSRAAVLKIHSIKRDLLFLRRTIWPTRELINDLLRDPIPLITEDTRLYLKDCYDHVIQIIDLVETDRELGSDLMDVYLSATSNRMNEIMKVLAIITTIFMPMSFIAGLYGMNFNPQKSPWNMPEIEWYWGYPFALVLMGAVAVTLMMVFRRHGWLEPLDRPEKLPNKPVGD